FWVPGLEPSRQCRAAQDAGEKANLALCLASVLRGIHEASECRIDILSALLHPGGKRCSCREPTGLRCLGGSSGIRCLIRQESPIGSLLVRKLLSIEPGHR